MSKYVKELVSKEIAHRLDGVGDALLVNVVGLDAGKTFSLRRQLRQKNIQLLVIKNSLARRATEGTPLAQAFQGVEGTLAMVWGSEDFVSLAKEITALDGSPEFPAFQTRGGVMDGEHLSAERVKAVSLWPSRQDQIRILLGQILSPGANLASQLLGPGRSLASQIKEQAKDEAGDEAEAKSEDKVEEAAAPKAEEAAAPKAEEAAEAKSETPTEE
ncbi:MAG: 50S ribosomal protein L10 [Pirellulaceae bacterium]|jgi:ribosomal protein L10|nr:50S ribosomal protein L10 [Pirellulaceae bacterium]MCU0979083.1 50S ribosomal protein L10 [Pirellulaceae bacterium]